MGYKNYYKHLFNQGLDVLLSKLVDSYNCNMGYYNKSDFMAHIIYHIISTTSLYKKKDIQETIWGKIEPLYQKKIEDTKDRPYAPSIETYKKEFDKLFSECWEYKFIVKPKSRAKSLGRMAYRNSPFYMKLYNSDWALLVFAILFLILINYIDTSFVELKPLIAHNELFPAWAFAPILIYIILVVALAVNVKRFWTVPIWLFFIMLVKAAIDAFFYDYNKYITLALVRRDMLIGCTYLLWIPIIYINEKRINNYG